MKKYRVLKPLAIGIGLFLVVGFFIWKSSASPASADMEIIARQGIHWHPELKITIKGVEQVIPADIGLFPVERPIHTHDDHGIIHLEVAGLVRKKDTKLGEFFKIWGKRFNSECIFDYCNGSDGKVKILVNGAESSEFENYAMRDGDKIEIRYE